MTAAVSSVAKPGPEKGRITGWHVLIAVVLFFGVVIGVDTVFMVKAYSTFSGEVASNPYEAGLAFNKTLDQRRRETALGWKTGVSTAGGVVEHRQVLQQPKLLKHHADAAAQEGQVSGMGQADVASEQLDATP